MQKRPPEEYLYEDAKNRFKDGVDGLRSWMPGHASYMEILASCPYYALNGCLYDGEETFIVSMVRVIGYAGRLAFYLSSILFVLYGLFMSPVDVLFRYSFSRDRVNDELRTDGVSSDPATAFVWLVFALWVISIASCIGTYVLGRFGRSGYSGQCTSFPACLCMRTPLPNSFGSNYRCISALALILWFSMLGVVSCLTMYAILCHVYVKRNIYMVYLFAVMLAFVVGGALADALSIGGVDGIRVFSPLASWLSSIRIVVLVPLQVIMSVAFIFFTHPPWSSA